MVNSNDNLFIRGIISGKLTFWFGAGLLRGNRIDRFLGTVQYSVLRRERGVRRGLIIRPLRDTLF